MLQNVQTPLFTQLNQRAKFLDHEFPLQSWLSSSMTD